MIARRLKNMFKPKKFDPEKFDKKRSSSRRHKKNSKGTKTFNNNKMGNKE